MMFKNGNYDLQYIDICFVLLQHIGISMEENHQQQQQKLLQKLNNVRKRLLRNKLILVSILNFATFMAFFFAMGFYEWVWVHLTYINKNDPYEDVDVQIWANLLYMKQDIPEAKYQSYQSFSGEKCKNNLYCQAVFSEFSFVGYICFFIFLIAGSLQLYDFGRIFYYIWKEGHVIESKDYFRHIITIFTYLMGITLSGFSILVIDPGQYKFGVSFWLGIGTLGFFVTVIIYEQYSFRKMIKQALILNLLEKQKSIRAEEIKHNINIELAAKQMSQDDGLSL